MRAAEGLVAAALMGCNMALVRAIYRKEELGRHLPRLPGDGKALDGGAAVLCALAFRLAV